METSYSTDLTDAKWECLELHVPPPNKRGRPKTHTTREILNAIFYILKSGCPWRLLPPDFPPWETVYWWFRRWRIDGTFEHLNLGCCASVCDLAWEEMLNRARAASSTPSRPRQPGWGAASREGLRWWQEGGAWQEASSVGGYGRFGTES
jgi:transposase